MVKIAKHKAFKTKKQRLDYMKTRLKEFTPEQRRNSGYSNLNSKSTGELDYLIQDLYRQKLKAVTHKGKEIIVTTRQADILYKSTPQYEANFKKKALNAHKGRGRTMKSVNSLIIHLTHYGFTVPEASWLVSKFGQAMAGFHSQMASAQKGEFFDDIYENPQAIQRYLE